jgi:hypothetical protein
MLDRSRLDARRVVVSMRPSSCDACAATAPPMATIGSSTSRTTPMVVMALASLGRPPEPAGQA